MLENLKDLKKSNQATKTRIQESPFQPSSISGSPCAGYKFILLTQGQRAIVDNEDYERINKHKWYANYKNGQWRAQRTNSKGEKVFMHREIMDAPKDKDIDHKDHNNLNNRKNNLRFCNTAQNAWNQRARMGKYKGVCFRKDTKKWQVTIMANGVLHYLGCFTCEKTAARERDKLAKILHGEFACLNFPEK